MDLLMELAACTVLGAGFSMLGNGLVHVSNPPRRVNIAQARSEGRYVRPVMPYRAPVPYTGGRVRALFIGINYTGTQSQLNGCINDVDQMIGTLNRIGFPITECCILVDNPNFPNFTAMPTRDNIIRHMAWLTNDVQPGDVLFLHYSGHGGQIRTSCDAQEKYDQCLIPLDHNQAGGILDDDLFLLLVRDLPDNVRMTCVFDCCHSASMLDLPFSFVCKNGFHMNCAAYTMDLVRRDNFSRGDVVMFSGCTDSGTSADVRNSRSSIAGGAATKAFTWALVNTSGLNYMTMLLKTRDLLRAASFEQVPQLTSSKPIDLYKPFSLFGSVSVNQQMMMTNVPPRFRMAPANGFAPPPPPPPPTCQPPYCVQPPCQPPPMQTVRGLPVPEAAREGFRY